jgi:hypothetical protein
MPCQSLALGRTQYLLQRLLRNSVRQSHVALFLLFVLNKVVYPQRLQIYNAPALEVATIGTFKLAGLFIFSMACLVVAPNVYADESSPLWMTPAGKYHPAL